MLPERGTLRDDMRVVLLTIERDALQRVSYKKRFRLWSYEQLANLTGEPSDWMCEGRIRSALNGLNTRRWLQENHRMWWKADEKEHTGLMFTCDPRTGAEWDRARIADRTHRDGVYLEEMAECAEGLQPTFRAHFRKIKKTGKKLKATGEALKRLGDPNLLKLLGVGSKEGEPSPNGGTQ